MPNLEGLAGKSIDELADLPEVAVGVGEETTNLCTPIVRRCQKHCPPTLEHRMRRLAVGDTNREGVAGTCRRRWHVFDVWFVGCRWASLNEEEPRAVEGEHGRGSVLSVQLGPEHIFIPLCRHRGVRHNKDAGQGHVGGRETVSHGRMLDPNPGPGTEQCLLSQRLEERDPDVPWFP